MSSIPARLLFAVGSALLLMSSCRSLGPRSDPRPRSVDDPDYKRARAGDVLQRPKWQDESGVDPKFTFWNLVNRCPKHTIEYRATVEQASGLQEVDKRNLDPLHPAYTFYDRQTNYPPVREQFGRGAVTLWLRRSYNVSMKEEAEWQQAIVLAPGTAYALAIGKDCRSIKPRPAEDAVHRCYRWVYSPACGLKRAWTIGPSPEASCEPGSYTVEGDMSKHCEYETSAGTCRVRYAGIESECKRR